MSSTWKRLGLTFSKSRLIDAQNIYHKMERRNLAAAYKFYCGRKMEEDFEAHKADQDTEATWRVLQGELDMYSPDRQEEADRVLANDMDELAEFSRMNDFVDFAGRMAGDFTYNTKQVLTRIRLREFNNK